MNWDSICRRAGGRRRYNAQRQHQAALRRLRVGALMNQLGWFTHGVPAEVARQLGVSRSTVCRDLKAIEGGAPRSPSGRRITLSRKWPKCPKFK